MTVTGVSVLSVPARTDIMLDTCSTFADERVRPELLDAPDVNDVKAAGIRLERLENCPRDVPRSATTTTMIEVVVQHQGRR